MSQAGVVAINARAAIRAEIGGVERLAREMALRLPALRPERYRVVRPPSGLAHRAGHGWEQLALPLQAREAELIYSPANLAPVLSRRNVVVIHDAAALRHPEAYGRGYVAYQRRMLPLIARRARLVITVSEFSRSELVDVLQVVPESVVVVPEGVGEDFSPSADPEPARARHNLNRPYVLTVGTASARKNLTALEATAVTLDRNGIELVWAGSGRSYLRAPTTGLRRLGYVADADLPGLYAGALALAMPSSYEGFGLPCLEAMASGVPVVAAARAALPETIGDAGILADPDDPEQFAQAVLRAAAEASLRRRLAAAGLARAAGFSWSRAAARTDAVIATVLTATV